MRGQTQSSVRVAPGSAELLDAVLDDAPVRVWAIDPDGVFTLHEGRFPIPGLAPHGSLIGKSVFEVFHYHPEALACIRRSLAGEVTSCRVGREPVAFDVRVRPRIGLDGQVIGAIGVSTSVTEQVHVERILLHRQKLDSLGVLTGGIAHDFNNILTAVLGNLSAALYLLPPRGVIRELMTHAENAASRAASLTRQLLAYSGKGRFEIRSIDLSAQVQELTAILRTTLPGKARISLELSPHLPAIEVDVGQLQQVVMNLVINAAEAISEHGAVVVKTQTEDLSEARAGEEHLVPGRYVVLEVRDTGVGMDAATLERIFDPFFSTKFAGRGLGLAAVQGIVRAHRGSICVHSRPGQGTTFRVLFPAASSAIQEVEKPPVVRHGAGAALIIDDDDAVRSTAVTLFRLLGLEALDAKCGRAGLEVLAQRGADVAVILLDLTMPELDGAEMLRRIRSLRAEVPVLLTSGFDEREAARRFAGEDLAGFLQKPFTIEALSAKLAPILAAPGGHTATSGIRR